jgi:hypothetical protein
MSFRTIERNLAHYAKLAASLVEQDFSSYLVRNDKLVLKKTRLKIRRAFFRTLSFGEGRVRLLNVK